MDLQPRRRLRSHVNIGINTAHRYFVEDKYLCEEYGLEILAYLQYTIDEGLLLKTFAPNVISHCKKHLQKIVSVSEIEDKLRLFWGHWHHPGYRQSDWKKIYHLGLKGLPLLGEHKVEWVRERVGSLRQDLNTEGRSRLLRSASRVPNATRDVSRKGSSGPIDRFGISRAQKRQRNNETPTPRKRKVTKSTSVRSVRTPQLKPSMTPDCSVTTLSTTDFEVRDSEEVASDFDASFRYSNPPSSARLTLAGNSIENFDGHHADDCIHHSQLTSELDQARQQTSALTLELDGLRYQTAALALELDGLRHQNSQLELELDDSRNQGADSIRFWKEQHSQVRKNRGVLKRRNKSMQAALVKTDKDKASKTEGILRFEIDDLREKLASYKATYHQFRAPFQPDFQAENIRSGLLNQLLFKFHKVLQGQDEVFALGEVRVVSAQSDLAILLLKGLDLDVSGDDGSIVPTEKLHGIQLRAIVLNLVSAALCTWVFEADVAPLFQENNLAYPKLRSLLAAQDRKLTDSFEFAAHKECIEDQVTKDSVIPQRARYLARRVTKCVLPLLEAHRILHPDQYAEIAAEWREERQQLTEIFKLALHAKIRFLLSTDLFKCAIPVSEVTYDTRFMEKAPGHGEMPQRPDTDSADTATAIVSVSIFPCLLRFAAKQEEFSYNRFLTGEKDPKRIVPEVLMKAVVMTG